MIRVGVALPTDGMRSIRIDVPGRRYELSIDGQLSRVVGVSAELQVRGNALDVQVSGGDQVGSGTVIRLRPVEPAQMQQGSGIRLHDVITGRGFHWQKPVSYSLEGTLEFRAFDGHVLAVNEIGLEDYLQCVITSEMSGRCPLEFLKSQAIVARSWVLAHTEPKHTEWPIDRCNDDCCQRFHGTTYWTPRAAETIAASGGQVLMDAAGTIIDANYSKSCGGIIEAPEHVWFISKSCLVAAVDAPAGDAAQGFMPVSEDNLDEFLTGDWLKTTDVFCSPNVVPDSELPQYLGSVDEGGGHFRWAVTYRRQELEAVLRRKLAGIFAADGEEVAVPSEPVLAGDLPTNSVSCRVPAMECLQDLRVLSRGPSGRASQLQIDYLAKSGKRVGLLIRSEYRIRDVLHEKFLFSSAFKVEMDRDSGGTPTTVRLIGAGWGHGAGLCQIGALGMAVRGYQCSDILKHYFEDVEIRRLY